MGLSTITPHTKVHFPQCDAVSLHAERVTYHMRIRPGPHGVLIGQTFSSTSDSC